MSVGLLRKGPALRSGYSLFGGGSGSAADVPSRFPVAIDSRAFLVDLSNKDFVEGTIPLLRAQADDSDQPSERSLNPEGLWRRAAETWHGGAGQTFADRNDSNPARFRDSKGLDVWTEWALSLLRDTTQRRASVNTNLALVVAGDYLYAIDGAQLLRTQDLVTWTVITGTPGAAPVGIATDGYTIWTAHSASGIYSTTRGAASTASFNTRLAGGAIGYEKGRLLVSNDDVWVNITGGASEDTILNHPNSDFRWVGFADGPGHIFGAGFSGDRSFIYKTAILPDGTALAVATVATPLPDGEVIRALGSYLGKLLVGTDLGLRVCDVDASSGALAIGDLIPTPAAVRCFEGQDRFGWFGWSNYDGVSTGLGRVDLRYNPHPRVQAPAFASDLMATGQGAVTSVVTFRDKRVFAVSGLGIYEESANLVAEGELETGLRTFGLPDTKRVVFSDLRHRPLDGEVDVEVSVDGGAYETVNMSATADSTGKTSQTSTLSGETFESRLTLIRSASDATAGPEVTREMLRGFPAPETQDLHEVTLILASSILDAAGTPVERDPEADYEYLRSRVKSVVAFKQATRTEQVILVDVRRVKITEHRKNDAHIGYEGAVRLSMKTLS